MNFNMRLKIRNIGSCIAFASGLALLSISPRSGEAATLPELPRVFMDTTYSPPAGNIITVNAGGDFQTALNNATLGDTIVLQAGATFVGPFTLPNKTSGSGWIYIRSSAYANLPPPGSRVSPFYAANMPKIVVGSGVGGAIQTTTSSHHFRFVGIEIKPVAGQFVFGLVDIGNGNSSNTTVPDNIVFDRCYVHGDLSAPAGRRGFTLSGTNIAVIDSHVSGFSEAGADSQAIFGYQGNGPFKIVNNFLEGASENVLFGGADPAIPNSVPSDIEIRRNHFFKPLSWIGARLTTKNLLEFKNAQRVLVEGNVFENVFADAQAGFALLITPRNQSGTAPWSVTQDITIRLNKFVNVDQGINLSGRDDVFTSQITRRILIENNILEVTRLNNSDGRIFQFLNGPVDVTVRHNTGIITVAGGTTSVTESYVNKVDRFDFNDNLVSVGSYGFIGAGTGPGIATLTTFFTNYTFTKNALIGDDFGGGLYPAGNFSPLTPAAVGFVNYAGGNYTLSSGSTFRNAASDGKDLGADIAAVVAAGGGGLVSGVPAPSNAR